MSVLITRKYKNNNRENNGYGKTYARIVHTETLTLNQFANHIRSHGSTFDRATIIGVMTAICDCLVELTLESKKISLGDLGTFYMSAGCEGADDETQFTDDNVKKVHLRFLPNLKKEYKLDSKSNRQKASLKDLSEMDGSKKTQSQTGGSEGGTVVENP